MVWIVGFHSQQLPPKRSLKSKFQIGSRDELLQPRVCDPALLHCISTPSLFATQPGFSVVKLVVPTVLCNFHPWTLCCVAFMGKLPCSFPSMPSDSCRGQCYPVERAICSSCVFVCADRLPEGPTGQLRRGFLPGGHPPNHRRSDALSDPLGGGQTQEEGEGGGPEARPGGRPEDVGAGDASGRRPAQNGRVCPLRARHKDGHVGSD